jgi:hypothetical protein
MAKILGKLVGITWDGTAVDIQSSQYDHQADVIDVTDNNTAGDGIETITSLETVTLQIDGTIKLSGASKPGKEIKLTHNSIDYPATSVSFEENWDEIETPEGGNTLVPAAAGHATRKSSIDIWMKDDKAATGLIGASQSATLLFATGISAAGTLRIESLGEALNVRDAVKQTLNGSWQGDVTETALGLEGGLEKACVLIYKTGGTDEKRTGNAIIFGKSITADVRGEVRYSYKIRFNSITETNYVAGV